ncbi:MAG: sigma-70 family RNA polymerase sigma factor [Ignavibacteria bacterium]|nr:sigma-70 family RNA polymerase sigma factor [Ignavibacteria bacterium]
MSDDDYQLVARVLSGDARAYARLVDRHKDRAFSLAVRLVGGREEAEELVQDAFVNAYRKLDTFRGDARFGTWLHRIVYNLCMTRVKRRRPPPVSLDDDDRVLQIRSNGHDLHETVEAGETMRLIEREISQLSDKLKTPLLLFYLEQMKYEEIARFMEIPVGSVKTYLFRGRTILRERLRKHVQSEVITP